MNKEFVNNLLDDDYYYGEVRESAISASNVGDIKDGKFGGPSEWKVHYEFGKLFHVQTLEPEKLSKFDIRDVARRKDGEQFLKQTEANKAAAMKISHDSHAEARGIIYGPEVEYEVPGYTIIEGVLFIGKADIHNPMLGYLGDLKSTSRMQYFDESIEKWYCAQLWVYWTIFQLPTVYVAVEKSNEFETQVIYPTKYLYAKGKSDTLKAIEIYKRDYPDHYQKNIRLQRDLNIV